MHYLWTSFKILQWFLIISTIKIHHCSIQVIVFLIKYVFFIIISFFLLWFLLFYCLVIRLLLKFFQSLQAIYFFIFYFTYFIILFILIIPTLLHSESQVVFPQTFILLRERFILFFSSLDGSDLVSFSSLSTRNNLTVLMHNTRIMIDLS